MDRPYEALGRVLLEIRQDQLGEDGKPLSQPALADLLELAGDGVSASQPQISRWESGRSRPRKATLLAYAELSSRPPEDLLRLAGYGWIREVAPDETDETDETDEAESPGADAVPAAASGSQGSTGSPSRGEPRRNLHRASGFLAIGVFGFGMAFLAFPAIFRGPAPTFVVQQEGRVEAFADERFLWRRVFPDAHSTPHIRPLVRDVDGDGLHDVIVDLQPSAPLGEAGRLVCLDHDGRERWRFRYGRELVRGERRFADAFRGRLIGWIDSGPYVVAISHHRPWYPSQVVLLDPGIGQVVSEFWHPGYIESFVVTDLDGDGRVELLLGGINNPGPGLGHPSLAVLDVPYREAPDVEGFFGITHVAVRDYILFPRPDVFDAEQTLASIGALGVQGDLVMVGLGRHEQWDVRFSFTRGLRVLEIQVADSFIAEHDRLHRLGLLDHPFDRSELDAWRSIRHFDRVPDGNDVILRGEPGKPEVGGPNLRPGRPGRPRP